MSGVSSGHLSVSRTRGVMPPAAVLGVAQAYGLDPLEEIARFPGFEIAWPAPKFKADQCLVLIPTLELIIELLWRGRELEMDDRHVVHMRTRCRSTGSTFCPEWWKHPEAVARFKALYIQYGHAIEDGEVSGWWIPSTGTHI